jgi:hypothetical protein
LLEVDAVGRADVSAAQQLGVVAGGTLEVVVEDPVKSLVVFGQHRSPRIPLCSSSAASRSISICA